MTEADYWQQLEYRLCREFAGMQNKARFFWCDGFIPENYFVDDPSPRITGLAWIGSTEIRKTAFELVLAGCGFTSRGPGMGRIDASRERNRLAID